MGKNYARALTAAAVLRKKRPWSSALILLVCVLIAVLTVGCEPSDNWVDPFYIGGVNPISDNTGTVGREGYVWNTGYFDSIVLGGVPITSDNIIGGSPVSSSLSSKVILVTRDMTLAGGDVSYTGVGFQPSSIVVFGNNHSTSFCMGFADETGYEMTQYYTGVVWWDAVYLVYLVTTPGNFIYGTLKSYDSDGFTLTWYRNGSPSGTGYLRIICYK